jgi:integrase
MSVHRKVERSGLVVWVVRWRDAHAQRSRAFDRRRDAETFEADIRRRRKLGALDLAGADQLLDDLARQWWAYHAEANLAARTRIHYAAVYRRHIQPHLGETALRDITPETIERFHAALRQAGVGAATIRKTLALLQTILQRAVIWQRIATNPVAAIRKPPTHRQTITRAISPRQVEALRRVLLSDHHLADATLISILAYAGLRPGEALALRWDDIRSDVIHVTRATSLGQITTTKTGRSRAVRLLKPLADDLAALHAAAANPAPDALLFPNHAGAPWNDHDYRNWRRRRFNHAAHAAAVPIDRPYDLRHAFVSLLINEGRTIISIANQAGHAPTMTLDTYGHIIDELEHQPRLSALDAINDARQAPDRDVPAPFPHHQLAQPRTTTRPASPRTPPRRHPDVPAVFPQKHTTPSPTHQESAEMQG